MSRHHPSKRNDLRLPFSLQKELGLQDAGNGRRGGRRNGGSMVANRKEQRKATRAGRGHVTQHRRQRQIGDEDLSEPESDASSEERTMPVQADVKPQKQSREKAKVTVKEQKPKSILKKTKIRLPSSDDSDSDASRASSPGLVLDPSSKSFKQRAAEDDAEIAALERRLGMKGKNKAKMGDDVLDYVLDALEEGSENESKKRKREGQDWLDLKRRKVTGSGESGSDIDMNGDGSALSDETADSDLTDEAEDDESELGFDEDDGSLSEELDELRDDLSEGEENDLDGFQGFDSDVEAQEEVVPTKRVRENPYIAPVVPGNAPTKYVPPSLRNRDVASDSGLETLKRQLQGHLNKLSEANMISILGEIERLYRINARQDVTQVLIDLILTSVCVHSALQNTFIILHAAFLTAVYKVMGTDFGAELLVRIVDRFDSDYQNREAGKESLNLVSLLANLFTFNTVSSGIIYDHVRLLLTDFSEANAELLLRVVRDCGPQLRSDDPSSLKSIVQTMQDVSADMNKKGQTMNVRTRVMMDTIIDLKNNKMKNATNTAGSTGEHITRMRKSLGSLNNRTLKATEPLRITRDDIANSDKKGKWWLVGASWKGHEQRNKPEKEDNLEPHVNGYDQPAEDEVDLLALSKQYRMNTDVRRSIFVAIMSANDSRDAQTRLLKLRLSTKQEQEIAKVLLRCARAEPSYNPYYALLAKGVCKDNKKVRMGFQFGLWDFFKRMGERADDESDNEDDDSTVEMHEIVNIAKMYAYLIYHDHMAVGVLKTLNIGFLKDQATMFLEILLSSIMTQPKVNEEALLRVFSRARETPQMVKGLRYFMKKNVRKSDLVPKKDRENVKEGCRVAEAALRVVESAETQ